LSEATETNPIIGIVGAGTMGSGIAQIALEHGHEVVVHDVDEAAIERGRQRVRDGLARRALKLDLDGDSVDAWVDGRLAGVRAAPSLDALAADVDVVIEAALEDLGLKQEIFRALDGAAGRDDVILATNTSALAVASIASATTRPERVLGLHFFNPAPVMRLVEVVTPAAVAADIVERAVRLVTSWGKTAVRCADAPGFIVNRVNRPYTIEALRLLEAGEASVQAIDAALRDAGFPLGPFELIDLAGVDVNLAAATGVWEGLGRPERLRPSPIQERLVAEGSLGRKTGQGFHVYEAGRRTGVAAAFAGQGSVLEPDVIRERILLGVVNEAYHAVGDGVAEAGDIDVALRLGAAHPAGPFERVREMGGPDAVRERLSELSTAHPRYEPAPALTTKGGSPQGG
jgi:3-hydroxybutyryl-CoA dehydrogenase